MVRCSREDSLLKPDCMTGAFEAHKIATRLHRQTSTAVHHSALFFRTSQSTRQTPRFLAGTRILPPLVYAACIETLKEMASSFRGDDYGGRIDIYFADREADPFMVELAGRLHAYIAALDSDFVILNAPGYEGYIPLDEFEWIIEGEPDNAVRIRTLSVASSTHSVLAPSDISASTDASIWNDITSQGIDEDDGFVPVVPKRSKSRKTSSKSTVLHMHTQKGAARNSHRSLVPPKLGEGEITSLVLTVYTPDSTAASLGVKTSLLPLLGSIVGNDATHSAKYAAYGSSTTRTPISSARPGATHHDFLFERKMSSPHRVVYTASTLAAVLKNGGRKGKGKQDSRSILEIIRSMISMMLVRPRNTTDREVDEMVNRIVEGALIYAIPPPSTPIEQLGREGLWPTPFCALHSDLEQCRLDALIPEEDNSDENEDLQDDVKSIIQTQYLRWYREGSLDTNVLDVLVTGTMWPPIFLESPDYVSASGPDDAAGMLRTWTYAILEQGVGIIVPPSLNEDEGDDAEDTAQPMITADGQTDMQAQSFDQEGSDDDEIIDVVEEEEEADVDPLVALKGALQRLRSTNMGSSLPTIPDHEESEDEGADIEEKFEVFVTEYVRRGARVTDQCILVEDLNVLLEQAELQKPASTAKSVWRTSKTHPIQLEAETKRLAILLLACGSDVEKVKKLEGRWIGPVLVVRWLIQFAAKKEKERGSDSSNTPLLLKRWTRTEVKALLCAFNMDEMATEAQLEAEAYQKTDVTIVTERSIQLMARALSVIGALRMLIQVLGLSHRVSIRASHIQGRTMHALCNAVVAAPQIEQAVWEAVEEGLTSCIGDDRVKKAKKKNAETTVDVGKGNPNTKRSVSTRGGMFSLLAEMNP